MCQKLIRGPIYFISWYLSKRNGTYVYKETGTRTCIAAKTRKQPKRMDQQIVMMFIQWNMPNNIKEQTTAQ